MSYFHLFPYFFVQNKVVIKKDLVSLRCTIVHLLLGDAYFFMSLFVSYLIDSQCSFLKIIRFASSTTSVCSDAR